MITLLIFIAVLAVLVLSHEFGHFVTARLSGMKVEEFGFGFPPRAFGIRRVTTPTGTKWHVVWGNKNIQDEVHEAEHVPGTVYSVNWLPLGGFVKIKGEDATSEYASESDSFMSQKTWKKMIVLVAGVFMNFLVAVILLSVSYMAGVPQAVGKNDVVPGERRLEVMQVFAGKPAAAVGIKPGDVIIKMDEVSLPRIDDFQAYVNDHKDAEIKFDIKRGDTILHYQLRPAIYQDTGKGGIGVALSEVVMVRYPWYQAIGKGAQDTVTYTKLIFQGFGTLVADLFRGRGAGGAVSGPVGVAVMTGQAARLGFSSLLEFMAILSLNLAVLNVLPIPALDGGRLFFVIISAILRRPITPRIEQRIHMVGFLLLILLVLVVTAKDIYGLKDVIGSFVRSHI